MKKALLVGETASLARDLAIGRRILDLSLHGERYLIPPEEDEDGGLCQAAAEATDGPDGEASQAESKKSILGESASGHKSATPTVELPRSLNARIDEILGAWEQPELEKTREVGRSLRRGTLISFDSSHHFNYCLIGKCKHWRNYSIPPISFILEYKLPVQRSVWENIDSTRVR